MPELATPKPEAPQPAAAPPKEKPLSAAPAAAPPKEKPLSAAPAAEPPKTQARATLEAIAEGKPVAEATAPVENLPDREAVTTLLTEANSILLELRDMRLLANSVATQAADTPLGNEVRLDALRSLVATDAPELAPIREKIKALNIPPAKPENSATFSLLSRYNEQYPDKPIPSEMMEQVKSGKREASAVVAELLQSNNDLAAMTWKELTGVDGFTKLTPSPENILVLSGVPKTPENLKKMQELFGSVKTMKEPPMFSSDKIVMGLMFVAIGLQFFTQLTMSESSGGGH
jgi:hypothetical protein